LSGSSDLDENETLYIEGMKTLFEHKEFAMRPERMCRFLELMESKSAIAGALMEFIKATEGVPMVKMGRELKGLENLEISIVGVPLFEDSNSIGTLGLIGPMRMEYGRVLGLLNSFLQSFNEKNGE
jgi:heat-inducible transcriptional repressor